jgi:hypothetical protein
MGLPSDLFLRDQVYAVRKRNPDDDLMDTVGYFTSAILAEERAKACGGRVDQTHLYSDGSGVYYKIPDVYLKPISVNLPTRESVLAKLSEAERAALGL